jgi:CheY-like chemotaxis protein
VVDDSFAARARITTLLHLGGWRVHQAVGTEDALRLAALIEPELVVTDMVMRNGHGATLMRRLREQGSSARFLVVASRRTHQTRALAAAGGRLGHAEVAFVSSAIARDARRGTVTHGRLVTLVDLCARLSTSRGAPAGQAMPSA